MPVFKYMCMIRFVCPNPVTKSMCVRALKRNERRALVLNDTQNVKVNVSHVTCGVGFSANRYQQSGIFSLSNLPTTSFLGRNIQAVRSMVLLACKKILDHHFECPRGRHHRSDIASWTRRNSYNTQREYSCLNSVSADPISIWRLPRDG